MEATLTYARLQDEADPLSRFRDRFHFPNREGKKLLYLCGHSLGLQPKGAAVSVSEIMESWRDRAVDGYFSGPVPWVSYHTRMKPAMARLAGCREHEVALMNTLSANIHFLLGPFYKPKGKRKKILLEAGAFPSDQYALEAQVRAHGFDPAEVLIEVGPRQGEMLIRDLDLAQAIREAGSGLALVWMGSVQYYSGQRFDLEAITREAHAVGALVGFDLAHAIGNVPLSLHDWNVDFAAWCGYKYLNGGPGSTGTIYVHERFSMDPDFPRLAGWGGYDTENRFRMQKGFVPQAGAEGWAVSFPQALVLAGLDASLALFDEAGMHRLREKSIRLTGYLEFLLAQVKGPSFSVVTGQEPEARGAQLSVWFGDKAEEMQKLLWAEGVITDFREPGVVRVAPAPMYNSFEDVFRFYEILLAVLPRK